jgi:hypothetical protein
MTPSEQQPAPAAKDPLVAAWERMDESTMDKAIAAVENAEVPGAANGRPGPKALASDPSARP